VNFGTTKYEHSVLRKCFVKTAVSDRGSISLVFRCPYFESRFPTVDFQISEMPIDLLLGAGTDRRPGRFQLPTPNKSIGPSEVARDCFKAGWIRLPLVGGRFLNGNTAVLDMAEWSICISVTSRGATAACSWNRNRKAAFSGFWRPQLPLVLKSGRRPPRLTR
jgi:hypothetical protein